MKNHFTFLSTLVAVTMMATSAQAANCTAANSITLVKNYKVGSLEYVEFRIKSPATFTKTITAVTGPFTLDPSDDPVSVNGAKFTKIQFQSVDWTCTIPRVFSVKPVVKDVKQIEQFEGYASYVIGRRAISHYLSTVDVPCGAYRCVRVKFGP
jgi:hypothetical protein